MNHNDPNIAAIEVIAAALGPLRGQLVLVGGCSVGLLISDPASAPVRETLDVDLVAEVTTLAEYYGVCARLRELDFNQSADHDHLCRWIRGELKLDVMPSQEGILGHSTNRWFPQAAATAKEFSLTNGLTVRMVSAPLFLATKLEAFYDRGNGDYATSHDVEDIINVIDGRAELADEVNEAPEDVRIYLRDEFDRLLADEGFVDAVPMHLRGDPASQARLPMILSRMRRLAGL